MINTFETTFEARERLQQLEKIYQGEAVDLVASITTDGVPQDLTGYSIEGYYQPVEFKGTDDDRTFYAVNAEIAGNKVKVHWTPDKDFGKGPYSIWALLTKEGDESYPVSWRLNLAHSPGYPVGETPEPIPQTLDFSKYTLLNAPWLTLTDAQVMDGKIDANTQGIAANTGSIVTLNQEVTQNAQDIATIEGTIPTLATKTDLDDYLPLAGGAVEWLRVNSANFNVTNLITVGQRESDGKMGSLFIGSDIRDYNSGGGKLAPIIIGNDAASYGAGTIGDFSYPNIALGNDNVVEPNGIVIGGACGRKYEYDLGTGTGANPTNTPIFNPKREDIDLNDLVFLDENGDPLTSFDSGDKITLPNETGVHIIYYRHTTTHHWGRTVPKRVGKRIQYVWTEDGVLEQNAAFYYLRSGNTGGNIKLHFEPDPINSVDHSAAQGFSIAIGNDTMAGAWISADVFQGWFNPGAIAIGHGSIAKDKGTISLGTGNLIQGGGCIGIGFNANTAIVGDDPTKDSGADTTKAAIQLGTGTNSTPRSLQYEDTTVLSRTYDSTTQTWSSVKLNPALLPDGLIDQTDLATALLDYYTKTDADTKFALKTDLSSYVPWSNDNQGNPTTIKMGLATVATGQDSFAQGTGSSATGAYSSAQGYGCQATGDAGHAEGWETVAVGGAHAEGYNTVTTNSYEHAEGAFNVSHQQYAASFGAGGNTLHSIGIGRSDNRRNAVEVMQTGTVFIKDIGGYDGQTSPVDSQAKDLASVITGIETSKNLLHYADSVGATISLTKLQPVYRYTNSGSQGTMILPNIGTEGIPTSNDYFCFEIELTIPSGITTLNTTAWASVTWLPGFELPQYDYAGKTLYISCRLNCQTRGVTASCWRVA